MASAGAPPFPQFPPIRGSGVGAEATTMATSPPPLEGEFAFDIPPLHEEETAQPRTVGVTGGTGYIGSHVILRLLQAGHTVRAACRFPHDQDRMKHLKALPNAQQKLKLFLADLATETSLYETFRGCDAVIHLACQDVDKGAGGDVDRKIREVVRPIVSGMENVLRACAKFPAIKRVVVTSTMAALYSTPKEHGEGTLIFPDMWNERSGPDYQAFTHAKVMAEKRAWNEHFKNNTRGDGEPGYELVALHPGMVMGPPVRLQLGSESMRVMALALDGRLEAVPDFKVGFIDVRDTAMAHCVAALKENVMSGRYPLVQSTISLLDLLSPLKHMGVVHAPCRHMSKFGLWLSAAKHGLTRKEVSHTWGKALAVDTSKMRHELCTSPIGPVQSIKEMAQSMSSVVGPRP